MNCPHCGHVLNTVFVTTPVANNGTIASFPSSIPVNVTSGPSTVVIYPTTL